MKFQSAECLYIYVRCIVSSHRPTYLCIVTLNTCARLYLVAFMFVTTLALWRWGEKISSFIYTNTSLWPTCTVTSSNNWAREGFKCLLDYLHEKKKQHWYSRSFFTVVSLCNTILIIKSHSNFSHCHSSHPWWLVPENDDVVYVTCNTAGFLNGVSKRVQCFGNRVCFHFEVTKIRNHLHIPYGRKRWCQPLTQRLTKCSSDSECLLISEHNGWVGPHLPWGWGWKQVQLPRYLSLRKRSDSYSWLLLLVISWQTSSRKLHTNKATNHVKVKLFSHYDIHCGFRRNVTFPKHDTRNLLKIIQT